MRPQATGSEGAGAAVHRCYPYQRALDGRKQAIQGAVGPDGRFYGQLGRPVASRELIYDGIAPVLLACFSTMARAKSQ